MDKRAIPAIVLVAICSVAYLLEKQSGQQAQRGNTGRLIPPDRPEQESDPKSADLRLPNEIAADRHEADQESPLERAGGEPAQADMEEGEQGPKPQKWNRYPLPWTDSAPVPRVPFGIWEEKYAGFDLEALELAEQEYKSLYNSLAESEMDRLYDAGAYTRIHLRVEVDAKGEERILGMNVKKSGDIPIHRITPGWDANGEPLIRDFIWLPPQDYPEIYEPMDEWAWLFIKTSKLKSDKLLEAWGKPK